MLLFLLCAVMLRQVQSACNVPELCPESAAVQAEIVERHNELRRAVQPTAANMLRMNYSEEVAVTAQAWVDSCILGHGTLETRLLDGYQMGENLFFSSQLYTWTDIINAWYSEVSNYQYPTGSTNGQPTGHYTQVIWNSSYKIGCGVKRCPNNVYFYGCHYYRAGNFKGWEPYKAGPPCESCPNACEDKLCTNPCPYINKYLNCPTMKRTAGCGNPLVSAWCPASCKCVDEIVPIY